MPLILAATRLYYCRFIIIDAAFAMAVSPLFHDSAAAAL